MLQQQEHDSEAQTTQGLLAGESSYNRATLTLWSDITQLNATPGFTTEWPLAMHVCNESRFSSPQPAHNIFLYTLVPILDFSRLRKLDLLRRLHEPTEACRVHKLSAARVMTPEQFMDSLVITMEVSDDDRTGLNE